MARFHRMHRFLALAALCASAYAASPELKYVVIVSRHGVRAPTWEPARLNQYSAEPWPNFGVPPGNLTPQGRTLITLMGGYYHDWLVKERLLHAGCADAKRIFIWADTDQRTLETGRALGESLLPGCGVGIHSLKAGEDDPLFSGVAAADPKLAGDTIRERLGSNPQKLFTDHRGAFDTLQNILTDGKTVAKKLLEPPEPIGVVVTQKSAELKGPFSVGSTLSENLLLEYANGMTGPDLGWGRLTKQGLLEVLKIHGVYADLMRRTAYPARVRGSNLLSAIVHSMEQAEMGKAQELVLVISGHDTNLSNLSGMLGLTWQVGDYQKDETPPGGALVLTLWRDTATKQYSVKAQFVAQTLDQMHESRKLTLKSPPSNQDVPIPGCLGSCSWNDFKLAMERAIDPKYTSPTPFSR